METPWLFEADVDDHVGVVMQGLNLVVIKDFVHPTLGVDFGLISWNPATIDVSHADLVSSVLRLLGLLTESGCVSFGAFLNHRLALSPRLASFLPIVELLE